MIVAAVLVVLGSIGAFFLYHYLKKEYTAKMEALVEAKLKVGLASVKMLDFPLVICFEHYTLLMGTVEITPRRVPQFRPPDISGHNRNDS